MDDTNLRTVLYETRHHASRPYTPDYPPQQAIEADRGSFLSLLSARGWSRLKEKWNEYNQPKKMKKLISLFISPNGERVAVAAGNQITILWKDDDYLEPCGTFTSRSLATFTTGTWSEPHDVLGVGDDTGTVYFLKVNGEEIMRIKKISIPIVGLIAQNDSDEQRSCLCSFVIITSDGSFQHIEISQEPSASMSSILTSDNGLTLKKQFYDNVFCFDYCPELSLLVVVGGSISVSLASGGNSGSCSISLWRRSKILDMERLFSAQFEGIYSKPKGYVGQLTCPKALISPEVNFVATLDVRGCLHIFKLDKECFSISSFACRGIYDSMVTNSLSNEGIDFVSDIVDFTWWSDHIIAFAKRGGVLTMLDILSGTKVQQDDTVYSMPVLERVLQFPGNIFLLESRLPEGRYDSSNVGEMDDLHKVELITEDGLNKFDISRLQWSLVSLSERSVPEMYNILISQLKYLAAFDFADCHGLDKDEVVKSQWLHSSQGVYEINKYLSNIKDQGFVISECVDKVGPTEDAVRNLLAYGLRITNKYRFSEPEERECNQICDFRLSRLQLLQFNDRLETYLGVNMGRFSMQEYREFRVMPIDEAAITLAESGKIGALNLLFKRHPYSLTPSMLTILAAIPETVPIETYGQLLPGRSPPTSVAVREEDWVECEKMVNFINSLPKNYELGIQIRTEPMVKRCLGWAWPSTIELSRWYMNRARDIDSFTGQLENCLCLLDFAYRRGIHELQQFFDDVSYLHQLIYSDDSDGELSIRMSLAQWEQLSDHDKFKMMLKGVKEENVVKQLRDKAIPFMQNRFKAASDSLGQATDNHLLVDYNNDESFLVRWMKEIALENKLDMCLVVIEEGCGDMVVEEGWNDFQGNDFFKDEAEAVDCALQCIYMCTVTDRWSTLAAILSKLPQIQGTTTRAEGLKRRLKLAEGHIEAGRLLAFYQVPKPMSFFLEAHSDGKGVKQILRLILSKFIRRQPGHADNDWANMWRDIMSLREKAFPFLDLEYMLMEFCRGLLKAGKFSLARNYLKGTSSVALASEKAENLVIQAAREYFFSASSLTCTEIWKAKECLNLYPSSGNVKAEDDIINALTVKLPNLGVTLLPMQFRQIKDPMEIVKMAITSPTGAYLHVDELIEVAKLLGLNSPEDISAVEEAIAREAAVAGDLQLAFDLCLVLAKKGHGLIWDLCAAIARGPALENMDIRSRKQLLGFALSHCDEESIGELLYAWKDLDMQGQCETLMNLTGTIPPNFSVQGSSIVSLPVPSMQDIVDLKDSFGLVQGVSGDDRDVHFDNIKNVFSAVAKSLPIENGNNWESALRENGKAVSFAALHLPWLLELSRKAEHGKKLIPGLILGKQYVTVRTQAVVTILSWLARNGFAPRDDLIASLVKSIIEPPATEEEDIMGCSFLLNLVDAFTGVEVIEEQLRTRKDYEEISHIMNVGMTYSLLHNSGLECEGPARRRELLLRKFEEKHTQLSSDEIEKIDKAQSTFWREWKLKLEEQKRVADHSRELEKIIPGVETERFLSGDVKYVEDVVVSLIESIKLEKKSILSDLLKIANAYGLSRTEVLLQCLSSLLVSEIWTNDDIMAEIGNFRGEIIDHAVETIKLISLIVYPAINGCNKLRLAYVYSLLSDCYSQLEETNRSLAIIKTDQTNMSTLGFAQFYKLIAQECRRVSFIKNLNFKNIAGLAGLNLVGFSTEVCTNINESSLEALAKMVQSLASIYTDPVPDGLITWQDVYKHYVLSLLTALETRAMADYKIKSPENLQGFISQLEQSHDFCRRYIELLTPSDALDIMKWYFKVIAPIYGSHGSLPDNSAWQECLIVLLNFWIRLTDGMKDIVSNMVPGGNIKFNPESIMSFLRVFMRLVIEDIVSPSQGWGTIINYVNCGLIDDFAVDIFIFCKAMIFSGCGFGAIAEVFSVGISQQSSGSAAAGDNEDCDLSCLYLNILEPILQDMVNESHEHQNLYNLLSSLSKLEANLEGLKRARTVVWERMAEFSGNLQLRSSVRVHALELMQFITGQTIRGFSPGIQSNVLPWEGWDELQFSVKNRETIADQGLPDQKDTSSRFTSTLIALKSSQLAATISPSIEITPDDLLNVETAVSCFLKLCGAATTDSHIDTLLSILVEWEGLFIIGRDEEASAEVSGAGNDWVNDNWDEGWENFQEVEPLDKEMTRSSVSFHPLHPCFMEVFKKLLSLSRQRDLLTLIDQSLSKSNGLLLDEDGARSLCQILTQVDCFVALKAMLLLPYEALRLQCLDEVEEKLKQGGISDTIARDHEFLMLVLSSGITSTIITKSSYGTTFSYLCYMIGSLSHQYQEAQSFRLTQKGSNQSKSSEGDNSLLFVKVIFPAFITELVKAGQQILAGFLITKIMRTNASLSLINIAEASLRRYLERQLHVSEHEDFALEETCETLKNTSCSLRGKLGNLIQSALSLLPRNVG
ncbi:MAG2-interacting protein 2 [Carya illinoinensis]|uniref:MAG2-interacting protein 2 n=1 Tax=Carya illinoinensis TaxID=32201 RepID=UPI001C722165|nr:MAG2-interacting protein 2 [Carya illinoinensis]XP_042982190.1 MAG2-interacting protein 2 [Carya illinoinensis]XP_042982191.1 MAG2-interacting protein 2 [Carya illinoinensis]